MKVNLATEPADSLAADLVAVPTAGKDWQSPEISRVDGAVQGALSREAAVLRFPEDRAQLLLQTHGALPCRNLLLLRVDDVSAPRAWYELADTAVRVASETRAGSLAVACGGLASPERVRNVVEGVLLAAYRFVRFRSQPADNGLRSLTIGTAARSAEVERALKLGELCAEATAYGRDLVNTPAAQLTPAALAKEARRLSKHGIAVRVHDRNGIARLGMGALLGVAQGSAQPPRFIELVYRPRSKPLRKVAVVGKGVTFDSGGLSLKNAEAMRSQKRDMSGAAVVLGAMSVLPALKPPIEVRGYIPATENMPGGSAIKPGDVVHTCSGKTVEILNTDAAGRLILADALAYAARKRPDLILDFATLTAAVSTALGARCAAIMGTDSGVVAECIAAGARVGERLWELPLITDYRRDIDSQVADLKNTGEGQAGTIIGGLFLREFVGDIPWAHVDFSSTAFSSGYPCHPQGASGFGVRTLIELLTAA